MSTANPGYQAPSVTVSSSLPTRGVGDAVLIVPVISDDDTPKVLAAEPYLDAEAVDEIEAGLRALGDRRRGATTPAAGGGAAGRQRACRRPGRPPRRVAAGFDPSRCRGGPRSLDKVESVVTTLSALDFAAAVVEGLILGAYRFNEFRSDKTAPKDAGLRKITVLPGPAVSARGEAEVERAAAVATAVAAAFVNTPPSHLFPAEFAERAKALGESAGLGSRCSTTRTCPATGTAG